MRTGFMVLLIFHVVASQGRGVERGPARPNVLLVLTDDQGYGDLSLHGNPIVETPNLDRLASQGARFDRFFVCPVCAPTRASLLTGRYHPRTGAVWVTRGLETMRPAERTLAELLGEAGYATGCFGKWHNGAHYPSSPRGQGFDEFLGFSAGHWNVYFDPTLEDGRQPIPTRGYITDVLTDAAIAFMRKNRDVPFFCYVPFNAPHSPFQLPDRLFEKYRARGCDAELASIYGMVEGLDASMGRMLDSLDELGLAERTIAVFLTDNGPNSKRFNAGMRGQKGSVHEGGIRVPCFVRWPGRVEPGTLITRIAAHIDVVPTLLEACGVASPRDDRLDGRSLVRLLEGRGDSWPDRMLFTHQYRLVGEGLDPARAPGSVRTQRHRWVLEGDRRQLFDMEADPDESHDIAAARPEVAQQLAEAYDAWFLDVFAGGVERPAIAIGQPEAPVVALPGPEAHLEGALRFFGANGWANDWVSGWSRLEDRVGWEVNVTERGRYAVSMLYGCEGGVEGSRVRARFGEKTTAAAVVGVHELAAVPTPDRVGRKEAFETTWARLDLGVLELEPGRGRLMLEALEKPGRYVADVKSLRVERLR